ncbi:hypothetical protein [Euzebya sp.]|uniref:hypothetical protein n=1 Tax=Euzebya sp. TaxID=1971409 RepID=UPI0035137FC4
MLLTIVPGAAPIEGTLTRLDGSDAQPFCGWMDLTARLEGLRSSGGDPTDYPLADDAGTVEAAGEPSTEP